MWRHSPPRVAARLCTTCPPTVESYFRRLERLIELQHEYPGETFYVLEDDDIRARGERIEHALVTAVCGYLALGLEECKTVLCRTVDVPQAFQALWTLDRIQPRHRARSRRTALRVTPSMMFGTTCVLVRATTMAATPADMAAVEHARRTTAIVNAVATRSVLGAPAVRLVADRSRCVRTNDTVPLSPFDSRPVLERQLLESWTAAEARQQTASVRSAWLRLATSLGMPDATELFSRPARSSTPRGIAERIAAAVEARFGQAADRYDELLRTPGYVRDLLAEGAQLAGEQAAVTLGAMRDAVGEG